MTFELAGRSFQLDGSGDGASVYRGPTLTYFHFGTTGEAVVEGTLLDGIAVTAEVRCGYVRRG